MNTKNWFTKSKLSVLMLAMLTLMFSCEDDYTYEFVDNSLPSAEFSFSVTDYTVSYTNKSNNAISYLWDFGDGTTSTEANPPAHVYTIKDKYQVTLTASDGNGKSEQYSIEIPVGYPLATFTYVVNKNKVTFTNTSANATTYLWDFGDGTTSTDESPTHTYSEAKEYTVTLTAYSGVDENVYTTNVITTLKLEPVILDWDHNADTDGWITRGCGFANSSDSYDLDDGPGMSTKINGDGNENAGDDLYQVIDVSDNSDYNLSFYVYQKSTAGDEEGAIVGTVETVVDGGASQGVILATINTTTTTTKTWNKFESGDFPTGANTQVVIRLAYISAKAPVGQSEGRVDYVEMK